MNTLTKILSALSVSLIMLIGATACNRAPQYRTSQGAIWGTTYHITYNATTDLTDSIMSALNEVTLSLSAFDSISTVSRINSGKTSTADVHLQRVFAESKRINTLSHGAFDPTVAPLVNLWGFGYKNRENYAEPPSQAEIDSALTLVGIQQCSIDHNLTLTKKHPLTEFNFSAIAKGYGVDRVAECLRRNGCTDYLVEIGGEIALSGKNPDGKTWHIQIDAPVPETTEVTHQALSTIEISDKCIATSGNYRNFRQLADGSVVSHTISPATGYPVSTLTLSATVIAPTATTADALATACMALPAKSALEIIEAEPNTECMLVILDNDGKYKISTSKGFPSTK